MMYIHSSQNLELIIRTLYCHSRQNLMGGGGGGGVVYIVTSYFHSQQHLEGSLYRDIIFSPLTISSEGVNISWHYIFTPDNIWWRVIRSWHIFTRDNIWLGVIISWHHIFTPDNIGAGVIILWHYIFTPHDIWWGGDYIMTIIFTPGNIWWGDDYIVTLCFHSWQYLVKGWLYRDIFSLLRIFGEGVIISWNYIIFPNTTLESGTGGDYIWIFSLSQFDSAVIPGFYYSYPYIHPMKLGGWSDYI